MQKKVNTILGWYCMKRKINCNIALFSFGGLTYGLIEILWRRYTHWSMILTGGLCFTVLYRIFKKLTNIAMWKKCFIGSSVITTVELAVGCIVNLWGKLNVWDYSNLPANFCGQICLYYSTLWGFLTIPISAICKVIQKKFNF